MTDFPAIIHPGTRRALLESLPKRARCAELGVFVGDFTAEILEVCEPFPLYAVDLFKGAVVSGDANGENVRREHLSMERIWDRFGPHTGLRVVEDSSFGFLEDMPEEWFHWVYIDTNHEYKTTRRELAAARKAVKPGGYICGHDYSPAFPGVIQAVKEFVMAHHLVLELYTGDKLPSYKIKNGSAEFIPPPRNAE
jgi:hypothetical protein